MTAPSTALRAPVKWAQRKDALYVTIALPDVTNEKVTLTDKSLVFVGKSNDKSYEVNLEFFKEVDTEAKESKWAVGKRNVQFYIKKKDKEDEFWPRLLECKQLEKTNVSVDWDRYADEDDEAEEFDTSAMNGGGFDFSQMMQGVDAPGMAGDEEDSDDEDLPDLESESSTKN